jgi:tagatose 6-phosphate kinase
MIVTVTLNPALEVDYEAGQIAVGTTNRVRRVRYRTGGRGLAVARVLQTFGHDVVAAGLAGGSAGEQIRNELARAGVATGFTRIAAETRRVVAITDVGTGQVTAFAEPAPYITTEELGRLAADYRSLLATASVVVLCGSLPEGLPPEIYGSFASYAAEAGVPVILDAGGSALVHGAARHPALVVPELAAGPEPGAVGSLAGLPPDGPLPVALLTGRTVRVLTSAGEWRAGLGESSDGSAGRADETFRDAVVAGFVPGVALAWSWPDILRHALALGAAWSPDGELDVEAYENSLTAVDVQRMRDDDQA